MCICYKPIKITSNKLVLFGKGYLFFRKEVLNTNDVNWNTGTIWCHCRIKLTGSEVAFTNEVLGEKCFEDMHIEMVVGTILVKVPHIFKISILGRVQSVVQLSHSVSSKQSHQYRFHYTGGWTGMI